MLALIVLLGAYLRFDGLGQRSLWLDEFSTWHVSRMDIGQSLRWAPELTKPPLYQLVLRMVTPSARPGEQVLRLPAAVCGMLTILAAWWLGRAAGGWAVGCALAGLVACHGVHIHYSQEARSYSMLVLGCAVSLALWHRLVTAPRWADLVAYVVVAALTFHAHYLTMLTLGAEAMWWLLLGTFRQTQRRKWPLIALGATGVFCAPMVVHYLRFQSSIFQGLDWIPPPTWHGALEILDQLTFGRVWVLALLVPSVLIWLAGLLGYVGLGIPQRSVRACGGTCARWWTSHAGAFTDSKDPCGLLLIVLAAAWLGLVVVSWVVQPAMILRYALPASIPALLIPLVVARRLNRYAPLVIMAIFMVGTAPEYLGRKSSVVPGFRELSMFLNERVDPRTEAVVLAIDGTVEPSWADLERLAFRYYPIRGLPVYELPVTPNGSAETPAILEDPRALYIVIFRADPLPMLKAAGRVLSPFNVEGRQYRQLLFSPYRLIRVAQPTAPTLGA